MKASNAKATKEKATKMKVTKKMFASIVCLLASLGLCVWTCFAWFSINKNVSSSGMSAGVATAGISDANINIFSLSVGNNGVYTKSSKTLTSMPTYGDITVDDTMVLVEFSFKYSGESNGANFKIYSSTDTESVLNTLKVQGGSSLYKNYLSNVVRFYSVDDVSGNNVTVGGYKGSFFDYPNQTSKAYSNIDVIENITIDGDGCAVAYIAVDYSQANIAYLYAYANVLESETSTSVSKVGLELSAKVIFESDISFTIAMDSASHTKLRGGYQAMVLM
jgi:hypothetical protein